MTRSDELNIDLNSKDDNGDTPMDAGKIEYSDSILKLKQKKYLDPSRELINEYYHHIHGNS